MIAVKENTQTQRCHYDYGLDSHWLWMGYDSNDDSYAYNDEFYDEEYDSHVYYDAFGDVHYH